MSIIRLGIVGLGNMGRTHRMRLLEGAVPEIAVTAVCGREATWPEEREGEARFTDVGAMIRSGQIDALLVATPHPSHEEIGLAALEAGLHVLIEKPLAVHKAACERLIAAAAERPRQVFAAMFNMRTVPIFQKVKELIDSGELGEVRRINWDVSHWFRTEYYYATGGWRATWKGEGGGVLLNQCPHNLDLYQWMFGMPDWVHGFCHFGRYHQIEVEDDVTVVFGYEGGKTGVFISSTGENPGNNRLEVIAERGLLRVEGETLHLRRNRVPMSQFSAESEAAFAQPEVWECEIPVVGQATQHVGILKNFADAILRDAPLIAPGEEGIKSIELANAALLSSWKGATVPLPMDSAEYECELQSRIDGSTFQKKVVEKKASDDDFAKSFR
jgi:predicted dehydrogenase